jgi:hypothetical protein
MSPALESSASGPARIETVRRERNGREKRDLS